MKERLAQMESKLLKQNTKEEKEPLLKKSRDMKNVILEGLNEDHDEDVYNTVICAIKELGISIFDNDINLAYRIGTFKGKNAWPRPIRVELVSAHARDVIWANRYRLDDSLTHYNVRVSRDEPKPVRKARALMRKAAKKARAHGKTVYQHQDHTLIDGCKYDLEKAHVQEERSSYANVLKQGHKMENPKKDQVTQLQGSNRPAEEKTKIGLAFFTVESKRSCFDPAKVTYNEVEYKTPEHAYQCTRALTSAKMELYHIIKEAPRPRKAKEHGDNIPYNPKWERIKPDMMYDIQLAKHEQHPDLGDELCESEGIFMEASRDRYWDTGVTILDPTLDTGEFCERNELGRVLGRVQKTLLATRSVDMVDTTSTEVHSAPHRPIGGATQKDTAAGKVTLTTTTATTITQSDTVINPLTKHVPTKQVLPTAVNKDERPRTSQRNRTAHSPEMEVLESDIQIEQRSFQALEPQIIFKEGTIVV